MNSTADNTPPHEDRLDEAIAEYLEAVDAGRPLDRDEWLARHPDLADDLRAFLAHREGFIRAADVLAAPAPSLLGTIRYFGDYELLEEIARGGMGVVYRARQISLNRIVALKMILAGQLASAADVRRFQTEAEAAANLDHPNIVPIYEVGEHQGQHYFSMKLIEGGNLEQQMNTIGQDPKAIACLIATVARAVHYAHQRGLLHRDLKPANILLDGDGHPHVTDFGLAKRLEGSAGSTQSGAIVGTPAYMPPEQARAEKALTTAADVYSLGAILYELLTGQPPFRAASPLEVLMQVRYREPAPLAELNPKADADLAAVALKCLEKEPNHRYPSAAALAEELEAWLRGEAVRARPLGRLRRRLRWTRQHITISTLALGSQIIPLLSIWGGWLAGGLATPMALFLDHPAIACSSP
jgi:serine/threonine-protein kinase